MTDPALPDPVAPKADGLPRRTRKAAAKGAEREPLDLARRIVELAEDKKAADMVLLELAPLTTLADYFVIASGGSERQLDAIAVGKRRFAARALAENRVGERRRFESETGGEPRRSYGVRNCRARREHDFN